ncbi:hypothetical protein RUMLAC_00284 [[Ruminococcus] lactaris ATCC 29176]|uniref:Uncharacterized protein n=1 Tax=[Ruminococcus] lactaris ATCC 29176 TaxID=471875 RepID=B5CLG3_9FIRM|nr:hypothetical protein RUMLAC_00284 [[Ruminococcus] lactaris ATCC 29176]
MGIFAACPIKRRGRLYRIKDVEVIGATLSMMREIHHRYCCD